MSTLVENQPAIIQALSRPEAYPFPCSEIRLVETHISWVLLTGSYAYKIKKPVSMGFLDFSLLESRRKYCLEEIRLNSRCAPEIYLEVVPISGTAEQPQMEGSGAALEYAVKMRQFDDSLLLSHQLERGQLRAWHIDRLADQTAELHRRAARVEAGATYGSPEPTQALALENFDVLGKMLEEKSRGDRVSALRHWTENSYQQLAGLIATRQAEGFVRECHGDLHLGNVTQIGDRVVAFDGIEFNESFRWIDVMSEIAFLLTDLEHRSRPDLAWRALSRYLDRTCDYGGLPLLRYYNLYRIMVRAKVDALRRDQGVDTEERLGLDEDLDRYFKQAEQTIADRAVSLVLTRGLSGSGKTFLSQTLLEAMGAVRLRSDIVRKHLFGLEAEARTHSALGEGLYSTAATEKTFEQLKSYSELLLRAGYPVIVDATFLDPGRIAPFQALAQKLGIVFRVLDLRAPVSLLAERLEARRKDSDEASEADQGVLSAQLAHYKPLQASYCRPVASSRAWRGAELLALLGLNEGP